MQDLIRKGVAKLQSSMPDNRSTECIVAFLTSELAGKDGQQSSGAGAGQSPGAKSVSLWWTPQSAKDVQRWIQTNNACDVTCQSAYIAANSAVARSLKMGDTDSVVKEICLSDLIWSFAQAISERKKHPGPGPINLKL